MVGNRRHRIRDTFVCVLVAAVAASLAWVPGAWGASPSGERPPLSPADFDPPAAGGSEQEFVEGELIVSFRRGVSITDRARRLARSGMRRAGALAPRIELARIPISADVRTAARALARDPLVEYAEPNYIYRATRLVPNDPRFGDLWGLDNTGQRVGGVSGTPGADIDAPEAWSVGTGSKSIVVAVVDTGVARDHPDLVTNTWINPRETLNGKDDSGNGLVDDVYGWDFADDNNDPLDLSGHGSHVAGTIAAAGHNAVGVTGVTWKASIMALRALDSEGFGTSAEVTAAFDYAGANGAHVVNASFGGPNFSAAIRDAIARWPSTLFVTAAGNTGSNNDVTSSYPCNYDLPNLMCVAATDQNDSLASFSNYGATRVHLGAPGVRTLSTVPAFRTPLFENFESPLEGRWTSGGTNNTWGRAAGQVGHHLADSPNGSYLPNTDSWIRTAGPIDLGGLRSCHLRYLMRLDAEPNRDGVLVEASSDAAEWEPIAAWSGSTGGKWFRQSDDLGAFDGRNAYLRFRLVSDGANQGAGVGLDDIQVKCLSQAYTGNELSFLTGSSMAAPHVAGAAALLWSLEPSAGASDIKSALLSGTDPLPTLQGKTVTGGRLNVFGAVSVLLPDRDGAAPDPAPDDTSAEPEPDQATVVERHDRTVHQVARRRLLVRGRVRAPGAPAGCHRRAPVVVRRNGAVVGRARTTTRGFFRVRLPARRGPYRVVARRRVLNAGDDVCRIARFVVRVHR